MDHFTVDGYLYERQGAGYPVDVIIIDGRGKSALPKPMQQVPRFCRHGSRSRKSSMDNLLDEDKFKMILTRLLFEAGIYWKDQAAEISAIIADEPRLHLYLNKTDRSSPKAFVESLFADPNLFEAMIPWLRIGMQRASGIPETAVELIYKATPINAP